MPLLESYLAMALTMLSFVMVATLLVERGPRIVKRRSRELRTMLESLLPMRKRSIYARRSSRIGAGTLRRTNETLWMACSPIRGLAEGPHGAATCKPNQIP
jgi:hypothetical protein